MAFLGIRGTPRAGSCSRTATTSTSPERWSFSTSQTFPEGLTSRGSLHVLYLHNVIAMPTVLSRRSAYDDVGAAFNESVLFYDYEMWLRIAARFDVGFLDVCDADYRIHPSQMTNRATRNLGAHRLELLDEVDRWSPSEFRPLDKRRARSGAYFSAPRMTHRGGRAPSGGHGAAVCVVPTHPTALLDPKMAALAFNAMRASGSPPAGDVEAGLGSRNRSEARTSSGRSFSRPADPMLTAAPRNPDRRPPYPGSCAG